MKKIISLMLMTVILSGLVMQSCNKKEEVVKPAGSGKSVSVATKGIVSLTQLEQLGKKIFFDNISSPGRQSCASCHDPDYGFTGPNSGANIQSGVYRGAVATRFGNRKPPSAAYATLSPIFHYDVDEELFEGGNFWDGRATGKHLGNPAADQALGPFLNPVEQNNASKSDVLMAIASSGYASLWISVWGSPISYSSPAAIETNYDRVGLSIAAYENSAEVNQFSSKFDAYLLGKAQLTAEEEMGLQLFNGKANCNACHENDGPRPLFTDFTYDNIGTPKNPGNPFYQMSNVYLSSGDPINPLGYNWVDMGLGLFLERSGVPAWAAMAADNYGKHKVPTLRNVDKRHGQGNTKAYMHNGYFKSLEEVVHFYNTRDVVPWPPPEVVQNVNTKELGNLGLTSTEEKALLAFLKTLSDGYQ